MREFPDFSEFLYREKEARVHMTKRQLDAFLAKASNLHPRTRQAQFTILVPGYVRHVHFRAIGAGYYEVWTDEEPMKTEVSP